MRLHLQAGKKGQDDEHRWQYSGICYADHLRNADE